MRPVSSRLMIAVSGLAALTMMATNAFARPGGHAGTGRGGFSHVAGHLRVAPARLHIRTVGRGYGAGDFGRASLGRGYGSGDRVWGHRYGRGRNRFGDLGYGYGGYGYAGFGLAYGGQGYEGTTCCLEGSAYPTASGIRAAPVAPPAIYVIGEGRRGKLRRSGRGVPIEADSSMADGPCGVVSPSGARIIRVY